MYLTCTLPSGRPSNRLRQSEASALDGRGLISHHEWLAQDQPLGELAVRLVAQVPIGCQWPVVAVSVGVELPERIGLGDPAAQAGEVLAGSLDQQPRDAMAAVLRGDDQAP